MIGCTSLTARLIPINVPEELIEKCESVEGPIKGDIVTLYNSFVDIGYKYNICKERHNNLINIIPENSMFLNNNK